MSDNKAPVICWFRSDLRLHDNAALTAAIETEQPVLPVFILDDVNPGIWKRGGASRWWLHHSLFAFDAALKKTGLHPLAYAKGDARKILPQIIEKTGATGVYWNRCYEPWAMRRDKEIKSGLKESGIDAQSFAGYLLFEPWEIKNKTDQSYRVYTPFSKVCFEKADALKPALDVPKAKNRHKGDTLYEGLSLEDLALIPRIQWYATMEKTWQPGEAGARKRFADFLESGIDDYKNARDFPAKEDGVSGLSPHLHFGEISPRHIWHTVRTAMEKNKTSKNFSTHAFGWLRQLVWREFSYHLLYEAPDFPEQPWNKKFTSFPWHRDDAALKKWQKGQTGYPIVDAGMRQLWQIGWMHNRVRMIVGSFLVKNLLLHWRDGEDWFWDTLVDADLGNNAAGWQWIAGCGADAAPYFRVFNPVLQSKKFDPDGDYIRKYVPELKDMPDEYIHTPWDAPPMIRQLAKNYPPPMVDLAASRDRALQAYKEIKADHAA